MYIVCFIAGACTGIIYTAIRCLKRIHDVECPKQKRQILVKILPHKMAEQKEIIGIVNNLQPATAAVEWN